MDRQTEFLFLMHDKDYSVDFVKCREWSVSLVFVPRVLYLCCCVSGMVKSLV